MDNLNQNIERLRRTIETQAEREMRTPKDFDFLSERIFEKVHLTVSPTTLKRMWGYLSEAVAPRISTLNILSQFVGFDDWESFCRSSWSCGYERRTTPLSRSRCSCQSYKTDLNLCEEI